MPAPAVSDWLSEPSKIIRFADRDVIRALDQARRDIDKQIRGLLGKQGIGAQFRQTQLLLAKRNIMAEQAKLWAKLGDITRARRLEAMVRVAKLNQDLDTHLLAQVAGLTDGAAIAANIADAEIQAAKSGADRMMARVQGQSYVPLSDKVYNSSTNINGTLNRKVNSALARGLSAREFATELREFINPNTPGGVRYAAMRLARTEINNSAHAMAIDAVQEKPWVESMQWHLSGSHPKIDICNELASGGTKGDGVYPKTEVPAKPHPQCFCFVTPVVPSDEDFLDALVAGHYNSYLERYSPGISERNPHGFAPVPDSTTKIKPLPKAPVAKPRTTKLPKPANEPVVVKAATVREADVRISTLADHVASGIKAERNLGGGAMSETSIVDFNDGSRAVRKIDRGFGRETAAESIDAEELASLFGRSVGVPEVIRLGSDEMYMTFVEDADTLIDRVGMFFQDDNPTVIALADSESGRRMALFDATIANVDRNPGNWMIGRQGDRIVPIDHGAAFFEDQGDLMQAVTSGNNLTTKRLIGQWRANGSIEGGSFDYTKEDIQFLRARLTEQRAEFARLRHLTWYNEALGRLDQLEKLAKGKRNLFL